MPGAKKRSRLIALAAAALCLAPVCLAGCGERDYYKDPDVDPEPLTADAPSGPPPLSLDAGTPDAPLVPVTRDITSDPQKPKDKTDKADIYWKLVYLADTGGARRPPADFRAQCARTLSDEAKQIIGQIVDALDRANDAYMARRKLGRPGATTDDLPWGAGRDEFDRALAPAGEDLVPPIGAASDRKRLQDFNSRYQMPPELIRSEAIGEARTLLAELLRTLNEERKRDGDFPITADKSAEFKGPNLGPTMPKVGAENVVLTPP